MQKLQNNATPIPFKASKGNTMNLAQVNWSFIMDDSKSEGPQNDYLSQNEGLAGDKLHEKWDLLFDDFDDLRLK
ncbi:hypothetical protein [Solitalea koreensis]|uniref:Uncharacterized protein n=1 Tax=Solitalea koreensis TaxID=543615 RepID=A0A521C3V0_9SPHI|nr:hypothetical protein [Solitalea koreensis]SMO54015.1 hypothetical protein SAMN06265350_103191 [Solitalea koreensis]